MDLKLIEQAVVEAGFELKWAEFSVVGSPTMEEGSASPLLRLGPGQGTLLLMPGDEELTRENYKRVVEGAPGGRRLRLVGRVKLQEDGRTALFISSASQG